MNIQQNPNNSFLKTTETFFGVDNRKLLFVKVAAIMPSFVGNTIFRIVIKVNALFLKWNKTFSFFQFNELPYLWLLARIGEYVVRARQNIHQSDRVDLLHLMLKEITDQKIVVS
jgi:hypothetical protein